MPNSCIFFCPLILIGMCLQVSYKHSSISFLATATNNIVYCYYITATINSCTISEQTIITFSITRLFHTKIECFLLFFICFTWLEWPESSLISLKYSVNVLETPVHIPSWEQASVPKTWMSVNVGCFEWSRNAHNAIWLPG